MGNYFSFIIVSLLLISSCSELEEKSHDQQVPNVYEQLSQEDSIGMWCCQFYNYYDRQTKEWEMSESIYCWNFFTLNDSIYEFFYPCRFRGATRINFIGTNVITSNQDKRKIYRDQDSLYLEYIGPYYDLDTTTYYILESFVKRSFATAEIKEIMTRTENEDCDTTEYFREKCINGWNSVWSNTLRDFY